MTIEFDYGTANISFDDTDLNLELLAEIRQQATQRGAAVSYLVPVEDLLFDDSDGENCAVVVAALPGVVSSAIDYADEHTWPSVETELDGSRIACLMLAKGSVALARTAVRLSGAMQSQQLLVLWMFDDGGALCRYRLDEDLLDEFDIAARSAEDHVHLTPEETAAWQKVAREASHIGVFDLVDLTEDAVL
ncbi:hypothetical protein [Burkholderia sp. PU8-34]